MDIKSGDVVWLKSDEGGQKFTVGGNANQTSVYVYWYDYNSCELKKQTVHKNTIVKVS